MTVVSLISTKRVITRPVDQAASLLYFSLRSEFSCGLTADRVEPVRLPELEAGQIWVIEISQADELSTMHSTIMTEANVIIYDHPLEAMVAETLPLGGYAEPETSAKTAQRCVQFARDGWTVLRLVDRQTSASRRLAHLRALAQFWQRAPTTGEPSVFLSAGTGQDGRRITGAGEIDRELTMTIEEGEPLVVFSAIGSATVSIFACALANGLAG